eukprot:988041-Amphidinium_carterae.1
MAFALRTSSGKVVCLSEEFNTQTTPSAQMHGRVGKHETSSYCQLTKSGVEGSFPVSEVLSFDQYLRECQIM